MIIPLLLAAAALAQEPAPEASTAAPAGHWETRKSSLLYYDAGGALQSETGLVTDEETASGKTTLHEIRGGAAKSGRFAWSFERRTTRLTLSNKKLQSTRLLRVFGTNGKELWTSEDADAADGAEPIHFSDDGESLIVSLRGAQGWTAAIKGYLGRSIIEIGPLPRLEDIGITPSGRYAFVRWIVPDQSATHTFIDIPANRRQDIASGDLWLGAAKLADSGKVFSNGKVIFDFNAPASSPTATAAPAKP